MLSRLLTVTSKGLDIQPRQLAGVVLACVCGVFLALSPGRACAQATGQVAGVVTDPTGSVLPKAKVELTSKTTSQVRTTTSGSNGSYTFPLVAPGEYQVRVSMTGFRTDITDQVEVLVNGTTRADVQMVVGSTAETVTVTDAAPLVETSNATMGEVVQHASIVDLPLNGRNFAQLGTLIPGVVAAPTGLGGAQGNATVGGFGDATGSFNVNGMRNQSNNFLLDGAQNNDSFNSGFVMRPPPDAIDQFKIMTHSYEAEYGRNAGSVVNVVTRSGSNQFHGSVWEFNREAALAARTYFARPPSAKPNYQQNQFGGAASGPIFKNKLFIAGYYEGFRLKDGTANTLNVLVPGTQERAGNFSELLASTVTCANITSTTAGAVIDPTTGLPPCTNNVPNVFRPSLISSISTTILSSYIPLPPTPNGATQGFYVASPANIDNRNMWGIRGDWKIGNHSILGRYMYAHQNLFGPVTPSNFAPKGNYQIITPTDEMGSDTWTISNNMINVARIAHQHIQGVPNVTSGLNLTTLGFVGFTSTSATAAGLPYDGLTGSFTQGDAQQPFAFRSNDVLGLADDFTWTRGKHVLKFGGAVQRDQINLLYINRPNGNFTFNPFFTKNVLADFVLGLPEEFQQGSGNPALNGSSWTYSVYGQDEYRVTRRITLQYGLRYEINLPYVEQNNHLAALHPGQQSTVQPTAPIGLVYPGDAGTPRATYNTDASNVGPRLGFIFDPFGNGQTSVRAAWGLFYDTIPGQGTFFQNGTLAPPFQPLQEIDFNTFTGTPNSNYFANPYLGVPVGAPGFPPGLTFIGFSLANSYKTPLVQQYNVGVQQQLMRQLGFELAYVGTRGYDIPIFIEVNPTNVLPTGSTVAGANAYKAGTRAVFPAFGLTRPTFSAGNSWYNALQTNLQLRSYHNVQATAAYTWSHSIDNASGLNIGGDSRPVLPATIGNQASIDAAAARERGPSLYDARNRFVMSVQYVFPTLAGRPMMERLFVGGWNFNTIFQVQSGSPIAVINSSTTAQSLTFRTNQTCNPNSGAPHNITQFFNKSCFALPTTTINGVTLVDNSQSGNASRDSVLGPGFNTTDMSLFKSLNFNERDQFEFRFEVFNIFNEAHFSQPIATFGTPTFGQITSTVGNDSRVIQMGVKFAF
jgi:hypothetical protein